MEQSGCTRICKANASLRRIYRSVVTKRELSNTAELSVFKSVFVPIFTYGNESWITTKIVLFHYVQGTVMRLLLRVHCLTIRNKVRSCEFEKQCISSDFSASRNPSYIGSSMCPEYPQEWLVWCVLLLHPQESCPEIHSTPGGAIRSLTCDVVTSLCRACWTTGGCWQPSGISKPSKAAAPAAPPGKEWVRNVS